MSRESGAGLSFGCVMIIIFILVNVLLGGVCTEYTVEFWSSYIKGVPVDVPFFPCAVAGLVAGEITIPAAVVTWLLSFVL